MSGGESFNMAEEFALEKRFVRTMETLSRQPGDSIWASSENRAEAKAIYNMVGKVIQVCDREGDMAD
jgi:hypothetical protein